VLPTEFEFAFQAVESDLATTEHMFEDLVAELGWQLEERGDLGVGFGATGVLVMRVTFEVHEGKQDSVDKSQTYMAILSRTGRSSVMSNVACGTYGGGVVRSGGARSTGLVGSTSMRRTMVEVQL
jgi:hypothetical protein